jgi:hypothetical protein
MQSIVVPGKYFFGSTVDRLASYSSPNNNVLHFFFTCPNNFFLPIRGLCLSALAEMAEGDEYRCFIGNLSWSTTDESLKDAFRKFGNVTEAKVTYRTLCLLLWGVHVCYC